MTRTWPNEAAPVEDLNFISHFPDNPHLAHMQKVSLPPACSNHASPARVVSLHIQTPESVHTPYRSVRFVLAGRGETRLPGRRRKQEWNGQDFRCYRRKPSGTGEK